LGILILVRIMEVCLSHSNAIVLISGGLVRCLGHEMRGPLKKRGNAASGGGKLPSYKKPPRRPALLSLHSQSGKCLA
jgi:hypothetical protein